MAEYTGENWQKDILARDWIYSHTLIDNIASRLYKDIYSTTERRLKLLEIPEMSRLDKICKNECLRIKELQCFDSTESKKEE